jgi:hypothetical protein
LKRLLGDHGREAVEGLMRHLLYHTRLHWITERHRYAVRTLVGGWNELASEAEARQRAMAGS